MTIKIRNKKINTKNMSAKNLFRLTKALEWEMNKLKIKSTKYEMLKFIKLLLKGKISRIVTRKAVLTGQ